MRVRSHLAVVAIACGGCAATPVPIEVPAQLKPAAGESRSATLAARGVQIYECRARKDAPGAFEWAFVAPEAELFDAGGTRVGRHFAGPRWESNDGSRVVGTVKERADAPAPGAIPWLLLSTKPEGPEGAFSKVTSIQRVNTAGGAAPAASCPSDQAGARQRVPYTADYVFFVAR